ncbi:MAG: hypothetical protein LUQ42_01775 [Methanomicrobiales archaeon]|nr:hypothetical protein [Methanomicrobiales archaeon]MDD1647988.1 hypothetical protein [Methanomicrobiales archaeon]
MGDIPFLKISELVGCLGERQASGENLRYIWCQYRTGKGEACGHIAAVIALGIDGCPPSGCLRCDRPGCFYGDFIRGYWDHPACD